MKRDYWRQIFFGIALTLVIFIFMPTFPVLAQDSKSGQSSSQAEQPAPGEVVSNVAGMTDEQVRQAYAQKLKQEAAGKTGSTQAAAGRGSWQGVSASFFGSAQKASAVLKRIGGILSGERRDTGQWSDAVARLSGGKGTPYLLGTVGGLVVIIALGLALRWLFRRTTLELQENLINAVRLGKLQFLGRVLARMLLEALGICIYMLATFIALVLFYEPGNPNYAVVSVFLLVSNYIIVFAFAAGIIFSPSAASLRLFPMEDRDALFLYKWIFRIIFIAGFFAGIAMVFRLQGVSKQLFLMMYSSAGAAVILALVIMIWQSRKRVGQAIWSEDPDAGSGARSMRAALARNWHYFATLYVLAAGGIWVGKALNEENVTVVNLILSVFLIPIVIGVDQWVQRLLKIASGESRETIDLSDDVPSKTEDQAEAAGWI